MICERFCNYHCSYDCPNIQCDEIEERYDIPCTDAGLERVKCKQCIYNIDKCCDDCYLQNSIYCKKEVIICGHIQT